MASYVFIDAANYHYFLTKHNWRIDWSRFKKFIGSHYKAIKFFYYEGITTKAHYKDNHPADSLQKFIEAKKLKLRFFKGLKQLGFKVREKPVGRVYDATTGKFKHKCNFDVELTIDAIDNLENFDTAILCSGDGDFIKLLKYLKGKWKKTVVIAPSERLSQNLERTANQVIHLEDIREEIKEI